MKPKRIAKLILLCVCLCAFVFGIAACAVKTYTVKFDLNYSGATGQTVTVESGKTASPVEDPEREGYRFDGWFTTASAETQFDFSKAITADTTVYAGWTQVYNITFDYNYDGGEDKTEVIEKGALIEVPEQPSRTGYAFKGWFTDATAGAEYNFNTAPVRDMTLYAHWAEAYTITLVYNYEGAPANGSYYAEKNQVSDGPADPARDGYAFNGWYTDAACTTAFSFARPVTEDTTIYAGWKKQLVMEAEYVDLSGKTGPGYSGSVSGVDMIGWDRGGTLEASNEYYVSYLYVEGMTLTFNFNSDAAVTDADIVIRITAEFYDQTFSSDNYSVVLNGSALPWSAVSMEGSKSPAFVDVKIGTQLTLKEGQNTIELITNNDTAIGGTMTASAPMVDCVKVSSSATLTWTPLTSNIE